MTTAEKRAAYIKRVVDAAPPLSNAQIDLIATILRPVIHGTTDTPNHKAKV